MSYRWIMFCLCKCSRPLAIPYNDPRSKNSIRIPSGFLLISTTLVASLKIAGSFGKHTFGKGYDSFVPMHWLLPVLPSLNSYYFSKWPCLSEATNVMFKLCLNYKNEPSSIFKSQLLTTMHDIMRTWTGTLRTIHDVCYILDVAIKQVKLPFHKTYWEQSFPSWSEQKPTWRTNSWKYWSFNKLNIF